MINSARFNHYVAPIFDQFASDSIGHFLSSCRRCGNYFSTAGTGDYCFPDLDVAEDDPFYLVGVDMPGVDLEI